MQKRSGPAWGGAGRHIAAAALAGFLLLSSGGQAPAKTWKGESGSVIVFRASASEFSLDEIPEGRLPELAGTARRLQAGLPDLPFWVRMVPLEPGMKLRVVSEQSRAVDYGPLAVAPTPTYSLDPYDPESGRLIAERIEEPDVYSRDTWWPATLVEVTEAKQGRQKWARVVINLFQYHAGEGVLRAHEDVVVELVAVHESAQYP